MRIKHRQLEGFVKFMETGTVSAAADGMCVSQPAMSKMLAGLEMDLSLTLFRRHRKRLVPTDEAKLLFQEVRRMFASLSDIERFAQDLKAMRTGELRVVSAASIGRTLVADALADFSRANPAVKISLDVSTSVGSDVMGQNVDVGFSVTQLQQAALTTNILFHANAICIMAKNHPLATKDEIVPRDLAGESFVSFPRETRMRHIIDAVFEQHRIQREMNTEVFSSVEAIELVSRGMGVAIVEPLGLYYKFREDIAFRPFSPAIEFTFNVVLPRDRKRSALTDSFLEYLRLRVAALIDREIEQPNSGLSIRLPRSINAEDNTSGGAISLDKEGQASHALKN